MKKLTSFFSLDKESRDIYDKEISRENIKRAFYFLLSLIPVSFIHVVLFCQKHEPEGSAESQWNALIISTHFVIAISSFIFSFLIHFFFIRKNLINKVSKFIVQIIIALLLMTGVLIASIDQLVLTAITPFMITTIVAGLIFLIPPLLSTIYYLVTYVVFYFALSITQTNPEILVSNQVNGLSITAIGIVLSYILWHSQMIRMKQRKKILEQNKTLVEINAEKDKFLAILAHDLKNPFNSIIGFSQELEESIKQKDYSEIEQYASIINRSSLSVLDLLQNLMDWSRAQTGRLGFKPEYFNLSELVDKTIFVFKEVSDKKSITIKNNSTVQQEVFADKNMLSAVMRNLISNAIKFSKTGGEILITSKWMDNGFQVSVIDHGIGIATKNMDRIFEIGESYTTKGTANERGTGLGLILSKEFVEEHNGKLSVESQENKGSTFTFFIPQKEIAGN